MIDAENTERRKSDTVAAQALAGSVPDDNQYLMRMVKLLLSLGRRSFVGGTIGALGAGIIMLVYVVAKWGVPAILATQNLILQLHADQTTLATADKEIQRQQVAATQDVLTALQAIGGKIDTQGHKIDEQANSIEALSMDVGSLKQDVGSLKAEQTQTSKRMGSIAAEQQRIRQLQARPSG